jgi:hypothetical protein
MILFAFSRSPAQLLLSTFCTMIVVRRAMISNGLLSIWFFPPSSQMLLLACGTSAKPHSCPTAEVHNAVTPVGLFTTVQSLLFDNYFIVTSFGLLTTAQTFLFYYSLMSIVIFLLDYIYAVNKLFRFTVGQQLQSLLLDSSRL